MRPCALALLGLILALVPASARADSPTRPDCLAMTVEATHSSEHFDIGFARSGAHAVSPEDTQSAVTRSDGLIIGYTTPGDGIPNYVESAALSLEYSYALYRAAGLRLPARQEVYIRGDLGAYGLYLPQCSEIFLAPDLRLVTHTSAHELFHAVQYEYWGIEDFSEVPALEQPFYKEATADAAMVQVMRPSPYVSWFEDPDQGDLFEAGTSAAFFWIFYGEQVADAPPNYEVLPGLVGLARYLEVVARPDVGLEDALEILPAEKGWSLKGMMEIRAMADLLHTPLRYIDPYSAPELAPYTYLFSFIRGFYNDVAPQEITQESIEGEGRVRRFAVGGTVAHRWNAHYHRVPEALYAGGGVLLAEMPPGDVTDGSVHIVAVAVEGMEVQHFNVQRIAAGQRAGMYLPPIPGLQVFIIGQSTTSDGWRYDLQLRLLTP